VSIAYGSDIALAKKTAVEALASLVGATGEKLVKDDPAPMAEISSFGESAVVLTVRGWCATADYWGVYFAGNQALKAAFEKAGVKIPFPQMDVHVTQA
jgi:small conductance mechanosensitive channel